MTEPRTERFRELLEKWAAKADAELRTRIAEVDWAATFRMALAELERYEKPHEEN